MNERIAKIRTALKLDTDPWQDLPDDLIEIAFRPANVIITKHLKKSLHEKYRMSNLEMLEFLGDAVLELATTQMLFDKYSGKEFLGVKMMSNQRSKLVRNTALFCLMQRLNLCGLTARTNRPYKIKDCADILEAIIGAMYYYLYYIKVDPTYMTILQSYIGNYLYDEEVQFNLFENNIPIDSCSADDEGTAFELGKDYVINPNRK
jgi:hypothetical protein